MLRGRLFCSRAFSRATHSDRLIPTLKARDLLSQVTSNGLETEVETGKVGVYLGADPTADSLHLGNLMPLMVLMHFYLRGHRVFPLIGGATGMVGDPSGRQTERQALASEKRKHNVTQIANQMQQILHNSVKMAAKYTKAESGSSTEPAGNERSVIPVNNYDWWKDVSFLGFLGTYGRHIRVSAMLGRESVRQRLGSEAGIGYSEFSYQILQAYDFYHLYKEHKCRVQIGGHDQWGNITAGIDLINRLRDPVKDPEAYGLTVPLLLTPSGEKFGKSAGNAIFLSSNHTKPYHMYQYLINSPDEATERYLKAFTLIPLQEISALMERHWEAPEKRVAQRHLAFEVTELIHGHSDALAAETVSTVMFGAQDSIDEDTILAAFQSQGLTHKLARDEVLGKPWKALVSELSGRSKSEAHRMVKSGAIYAGRGNRVVDTLMVEPHHLSENGMLLVRVGKTNYYVVEVV